MKIDEYLNERLTIDSHADKMEENYRGLMEIEGIERDPMQESYIKLNRFERFYDEIIRMIGDGGVIDLRVSKTGGVIVCNRYTNEIKKFCI